MYLLYTLEWTAIFYLYACLLRRFRVLTISLSVGIPLLFVILMFIPAVREGLATIRGNNQGEILVLGLRWLQILQDILRFVEEHWETLQLTAGYRQPAAELRGDARHQTAVIGLSPSPMHSAETAAL